MNIDQDLIKAIKITTLIFMYTFGSMGFLLLVGFVAAGTWTAEELAMFPSFLEMRNNPGGPFFFLVGCMIASAMHLCWTIANKR